MKVNNILAESAGFNKRMSEETKGVVSKWVKTGLLEGLSSDFEKSGMATLLENQAKQLVSEASATGQSANSEEWAGVALPLVRRIFSEIAAKEFVSVQPMNLPSGLVFYLDFKYGTDQPGFTTGAGKDSQSDSVFGVTETAGQATGGLYGAGRFGYSINDVATTTLTNHTSASIALGSAAGLAIVDYDTSFSASATTANTNLSTVSVPTASLSGFDAEGVRAFSISGSGIVDYYPQYTKVVGSNVRFVVEVPGAIAADYTVVNYVVRYQKQPTDITRGDFEQTAAGFAQNAETDLGIPELNVELRSIPIVAKTRKLKAVWTPEFAQDLNAYHSIDAEAELTSMLSEYVSMEIDLEILDMLIAAAPTTEYWSALNNNFWNGTGFTQSGAGAATAAGDGYYNTQGGWFQTLGTKLQKVSNKIHQKTLRGGANFLVTSPAVATILESIPGFAADTDGNKMEFAAGVQKIGAINNRYTVYKNPYMTENVILMGFRGAQFLETGAVFAPYIPLIMTPLVYDPVNFTPRKGVMTRYAKKVVRPEFYGKVYVHGLNSL